jgi:hypothetical protein
MAGLTTEQIHSITSDQIKGFDAEDLAKLNMAQVLSFATESLAALTAAQLDGLYLATPIVLDLDGNGISTLSAADGVNFDVNGTGNTSQKWGWVGGNDGLLVRDLNGDGIINSGKELFGSGTELGSGQRATDGYAAMRELDLNHDGKLNALDQSFGELKVWVDADSDGQTDGGELKSLQELGITEMNLAAQANSTIDQGNLVGLVSGYTTSDGQTHTMADVWFAKDNSQAAAPAPQLGDVLAGPAGTLLGEGAAVKGSDLDHSQNAQVSQQHLFVKQRPDDDELQRMNPLI